MNVFPKVLITTIVPNNNNKTLQEHLSCQFKWSLWLEFQVRLYLSHTSSYPYILLDLEVPEKS